MRSSLSIVVTPELRAATRRAMATAKPEPIEPVPAPAPLFTSWANYLLLTTPGERRAWCAKKAKGANRPRLMSGDALGAAPDGWPPLRRWSHPTVRLRRDEVVAAFDEPGEPLLGLSRGALSIVSSARCISVTGTRPASAFHFVTVRRAVPSSAANSPAVSRNASRIAAAVRPPGYVWCPHAASGSRKIEPDLRHTSLPALPLVSCCDSRIRWTGSRWRSVWVASGLGKRQRNRP